MLESSSHLVVTAVTEQSPHNFKEKEAAERWISALICYVTTAFCSWSHHWRTGLYSDMLSEICPQATCASLVYRHEKKKNRKLYVDTDV